MTRRQVGDRVTGGSKKRRDAMTVAVTETP